MHPLAPTCLLNTDTTYALASRHLSPLLASVFHLGSPYHTYLHFSPVTTLIIFHASSVYFSACIWPFVYLVAHTKINVPTVSMTTDSEMNASVGTRNIYSESGPLTDWTIGPTDRYVFSSVQWP